jgi:hypothetical protein
MMIDIEAMLNKGHCEVVMVSDGLAAVKRCEK